MAQVYVCQTSAHVPRPPRELKGFLKVTLRPGETRRVTVTLDVRSFAYYGAGAERCGIDPGEFQVLVGRSPARIEPRGRVALSEAAAVSFG